MSLNLDFSSHPTEVWDNQEKVRVTSVRDAGDFLMEITGPIRQAVTFKEAAATGGVLTQKDCHWFLPGVLFRGQLTPKMGDLITAQLTVDSVYQSADGTFLDMVRQLALHRDLGEWTILDLTYEDLDQVWDCTCRNFVIAESLRDVISIREPLVRQDSALGRVTGAANQWPPKAGGDAIPARIQEISSAPVDEAMRRAQAVMFDIYVGRRVRVTVEDLVRDQHGNHYEILSSEQPDRIDVLQVLRCRRVGAGDQP